MPGDFSRATTRLPGCDGVTCTNGNADSMVGTKHWIWYHVDSILTNENVQFWNHLGLADLISGVIPNPTTNEWGKSNPASSISGGFHVRFVDMRGGFPAGGNYLVMRNDVRGRWMCGGGGSPNANCAISPYQAWKIDQKTDDGRAYSGITQALSANHSNGCGNSNLGNQDSSGYDVTEQKKACDIFFKIN